jgi:hypothetical protein
MEEIREQRAGIRCETQEMFSLRTDLWSLVSDCFLHRLPKFSGSALGSPRLSLMSTVDWPVNSKRFRHL